MTLRTGRPISFPDRVRLSLSASVAAGLLLLGACSSDSDSPAETPSSIGAGTENRAWVDPSDPVTDPTRYPITAEEIFVTMRDGVRLGARLLLPEGAPAGRPCVLMANGYGHNTPTGDAVAPTLTDLVARGYAGLHASLRGSGNSEGEAGLYEHFGPDGYDLVEWMAVQPWCNGRVGMVGSSLLGIVQWMTARETPPSLKAISPNIACGDCYEYLWYPGGMLPGPGRVSRGPVEYGPASLHRNFDAFWVQRTTSAADHQAIAANGIPALITGGWNDYISPANIEAFEDMPAQAAKMLVVGAGAHSEVLDVAPYSIFEFRALWMDRFLRQLDNGVGVQNTALIYVQGAEQWRYEPQWPIPDTNQFALHLVAMTSDTNVGINNGMLTAAAPTSPTASAAIDYSPETGPFLPTLLSGTTGRFAGDVRPAEAATLSWTTEALDEPTEFTGWARVDLWASITGDDADLVVQISDVAPDGSSRQVTAGYLNASRAQSRAEPVPIPQGVPRAYSIKVLPTSYVFKAGHRIRLSIAGGAELGEGLTGPQGPGKNPHASSITIHQSTGLPSVLHLPVIGTGAANLGAGR